MKDYSRRDFLKIAGTTGAVSALGVMGFPAIVNSAKASGRVVVVGGGFGGASCAKYIRKFDSAMAVTLVEPKKAFITCPFSNLVLGGLREMPSITHSYDALKGKHGVDVMHDMVTEIDAAAKKVKLAGGKTLEYDRLVVSPGIDFKWDAIEGYDAAASKTIPHAWQPGEQTTTLRKQIEAMADGGVYIMVAPPNPFRCPPGPYERVSMVANYLKQNKPKSKILILDPKDKFSKQPLFMQGWEKLYPGMIEWVKGSDGGKVDEIDVATRTLTTELGDKHKGDVINLIPPQKAGAIAFAAGLTNADGWCPVDQRSFESKVHKGVHVIGDSSVAGKMPKSGFAASSQGKVAAAAIVSAMAGETMPEPSYVNTCYSLVGPNYGISVAAVYRLGTDGTIVKVEGSGGVSPKDVDDAFRAQEAVFTRGWYDSITADIWA